jgi:hypothetical protein
VAGDVPPSLWRKGWEYGRLVIPFECPVKAPIIYMILSCKGSYHVKYFPGESELCSMEEAL